MTKDEIIRMAREAEFQISDVFGPHVGPHPIGPQLERFAELVAAAEREACLNACNEVDEPGWNGYECPNTFQDGVFACFKSIRSRGQQ